MRDRVLHLVRLACLAAVAGAGLPGCSGDPIVVPDSREPFLYLVLNERTPDRNTVDRRMGQHALLLTAGSPVAPAEYRGAERFEMRRVSDGARFAWEARGMEGPVPSYPAAPLDRPNFSLPDSAPGPLLGADALEPGETYELRIETEGRTVGGRVTIPESFQVSLVEGGGRRTAVWPRVEGADGYRIEIEDSPVQVQTDTAFVLPARVPGGRVRVSALDPALFRYLTDPRAGRAGVENAYGVLGATSSAELEL